MTAPTSAPQSAPKSGPKRAPKTAPKHAPRAPFLLLLLGLFAGGMVLLLVLNTASAANEVSRHDLAVKDAAVAASVQGLRNQVAASAAPGNLMNAAQQLGMVPAGNPAFLVIGADGRVTVMGRPGAANQPALPVVPTPKPTPKPKPKPSATAKPGATSSSAAKAGAKKSGAKKTPAKKTPAKASGSTAPKPPRPTPTPTPTVTIPGGAR